MSSQVPAVGGPDVARTVGDHVGWLAQVSVLSDHVLAVGRTVIPPVAEVVEGRTRRVAELMVLPVGMALVSNLRYARLAECDADIDGFDP
jgi:hypothetical protein